MSYSVLVVDDEDLTLRTVSRGLRQEGFEVFTASSGEDALKVFAEEQPDLTLLDIVLPGIDGVEVARKAAESDHTTRLLQGESGTGKSVFAKAIHYASPRAAMPLLELNCAALPDTLLESELFGFEPGAFTDARRRKEGLLERAHG